MSDVLNVTKRTTRGTSQAKRERAAGQIPAILYGHGEESVALSVPRDELEAVIRHGARVVDLKGDLSENAFIREVQWDALGIDPLHLDLNRVRAGEKIEATIPVELRGEAPGAKVNGVVNQTVHEITIECFVMKLPEKIECNINELELDQSISVAELELPEGARLLSDPDETVVTCQEPEVIPEEEEEGLEVAGAAEPEVIGKDEEESEGGDEEG